MLKINKIFFLDSVSSGQFGKLNLVGLIPTRTISVASIPYNFITNILLLGESNKIPGNLFLKLESFDSSGNKQTSQIIDLTEDSKSIGGSPPYQIFLIIPVKIAVTSICSLDVILFDSDGILYKENFNFEIGNAPASKIDEHLPHSKIFSGDELADNNFIKKLLGTADKNLKIFDDYVTPESLLDLLCNVGADTEIFILTLPKHRTLFESNTNINEKFPNLIIKYSYKVHDRFVVINHSEYYHFGHSLKDLVSGKLSRTSKLIEGDEIMKLETSFNSIWEESQK